MDKKRIGSFVVGGLAGMLAGVLLAPKSGRETRGGFADRAGEARQRTSEAYFDARERLRERASSNANATQDMTTTPGATHAPELPVERGPGLPEEVYSEPENTGRPLLRDVSQTGPAADSEVPSAADEAPPQSGRSDELRRKIRETRERLKARGPDSGASGDRKQPDEGRGDAR